MITFNDLTERLKQEDEITLLEILDLSSCELVDALEGLIEDRQDRVRNYYNETTEESHWEKATN
jgi:hypothetical protein